MNNWRASHGYSAPTDEPVERLSVNIGNWDIAINRYGGDNERVQVFVTDRKGDDDFYASIPMSEVNDYIADKIGMEPNEVMALTAKG